MKQTEWAVRILGVIAIVVVVLVYRGDSPAMQTALLAVLVLVLSGLLALRSMEVRSLRTKLTATEEIAVDALRSNSTN